MQTPTVDHPRASSAVVDRDELAAQTSAAERQLEAAIAQLRGPGNGHLLAEAEAQRQSLAGLLRSLASAKPEDLPALRAQIAAATAAGAHLAQQANPATGRTEQAELDAARDASRQQVRSLLRDMHQFDPYLRFASPEDEEAYRRREAERRTYIERQHARGTPQGDLNAAGAAVDQMVDAQAHGADRSPEFRQRFDELVDTTAQLRDRTR